MVSACLVFMQQSLLFGTMDTITASIDVAVSPERLWRVLTEPALMLRWNNGASVETTWQPQTPIVTSGSLGAKKYRDVGLVEAFEPPRRLRYRFHSKISGLPDRPEHHHVLSMELNPAKGGTRLTVTHVVPPSPIRRSKDWVVGPESGRKHVEFGWRVTLPIIKSVAESTSNEAPATAK
jgi:uncharacterized protein YndB with AHSA1/START domain